MTVTIVFPLDWGEARVKYYRSKGINRAIWPFYTYGVVRMDPKTRQWSYTYSCPEIDPETEKNKQIR
jgi:hypothetical protein